MKQVHRERRVLMAFRFGAEQQRDPDWLSKVWWTVLFRKLPVVVSRVHSVSHHFWSTLAFRIKNDFS